MALQHPQLLPHVKEKQIGLLNSCQAKWGCTENKQKGNWIRGRVHATLTRVQIYSFLCATAQRTLETSFGEGEPKSGGGGSPGMAGVGLLNSWEGRGKGTPALPRSWLYFSSSQPWFPSKRFSRISFQRVNRKLLFPAPSLHWKRKSLFEVGLFFKPQFGC